MSAEVVELPDGTPLNLFCNKFMRRAVSMSREAAAAADDRETNAATAAEGEVLSPAERRRRRRQTLLRLAEEEQQQRDGTAPPCPAANDAPPEAAPDASPVESCESPSAVSFSLPPPSSPLPPVQPPGSSPKQTSSSSSKAVSFARELEAVRRIPSRRDFACASVGTASSGPLAAPLGPAAPPSLDQRRPNTPRKKKKGKKEQSSLKNTAAAPTEAGDGSSSNNGNNCEIPPDSASPLGLPAVTSPVGSSHASMGATPLPAPEELASLMLPPRLGELGQTRAAQVNFTQARVAARRNASLTAPPAGTGAHHVDPGCVSGTIGTSGNDSSSAYSSAGSSVQSSFASSRASSAAPSPVFTSSLSFAPRSPCRAVTSAGTGLGRRSTGGVQAPMDELGPSPASGAPWLEEPPVPQRSLGSHDALAAALASMAGLRPDDSPPPLFGALKARRPITEQAASGPGPMWGRASSVRASLNMASPGASPHRSISGTVMSGGASPLGGVGAGAGNGGGGGFSPQAASFSPSQHVRSVSEASPLSLPARVLLPDQAAHPHAWSGSGAGGASPAPAPPTHSGSVARVSLNLSHGGWSPVLSPQSRLGSAAATGVASPQQSPPYPSSPHPPSSQLSSPRDRLGHSSHLRSPSRGIGDLTSSLYSASRRDASKRLSTGAGVPLFNTYHTWSFTRSPMATRAAEGRS